MQNLKSLPPSDIRKLIRNDKIHGPTAGLALGFAQANLVILPEDYAFEFMLFSFRNPKPCPILDITEPGNPEPEYAAPGADIRRDLPKYEFMKKAN